MKRTLGSNQGHYVICVLTTWLRGYLSGCDYDVIGADIRYAQIHSEPLGY